MNLEHIHLTVNAKVDPAFLELSRDSAQAFVNKLLRVTDMKPLGSLQWSDAVDLEFPGQSFVQMITTSHCSLHFFSSTHEIYFDLYSCKKFDPEAVVELIDDTFGVKEWHGTLYTRATQDRPNVREIGSHLKKKIKMKATC